MKTLEDLALKWSEKFDLSPGARFVGALRELQQQHEAELSAVRARLDEATEIMRGAYSEVSPGTRREINAFLASVRPGEAAACHHGTPPRQECSNCVFESRPTAESPAEAGMKYLPPDAESLLRTNIAELYTTAEPRRAGHRWKSGGAGGQTMENTLPCAVPGCGLPPGEHGR